MTQPRQGRDHPLHRQLRKGIRETEPDDANWERMTPLNLRCWFELFRDHLPDQTPHPTWTSSLTGSREPVLARGDDSKGRPGTVGSSWASLQQNDLLQRPLGGSFCQASSCRPENSSTQDLCSV